MQITAAVLLAAALASAGSAKYVSVFKNPAAGPIDLTGKKVAAFVINPDPSMREGREETLATELRQRGIDCIAGYTVMPREFVNDLQQAKAFLKKANISGAILMRILGDEEKTFHYPGNVLSTQSSYPSFWGYWNYGWSSVYVPGYQWTDRVITLETLIYSIEKDELIWAGQSESARPTDVRKFVKDLVNAAGREMRKAGLVRK